MSSVKIFNTLTPSTWSLENLVEDTYREKKYWQASITHSLSKIGKGNSFTSTVSHAPRAFIYTVGILPLYIPVLNLITYVAYSVLFQFNLNQQYVNALNSGNTTGALILGQRGADLKMTDKEKNTLFDLFSQNLLSNADPSAEDLDVALELFQLNIPFESLSLKPKKESITPLPSLSGGLVSGSTDISNIRANPFSSLLLEDKNIDEIINSLENNFIPLVTTDSITLKNTMLELLSKKIHSGEVPEKLKQRRVIYIDMKSLANSLVIESYIKSEQDKITRNGDRVLLVLENYFVPNRFIDNFGSKFLSGLNVPYILLADNKSVDKEKRYTHIPLQRKAPTKEEAHLLLNDAKNLFESHFGLEIKDEAITCAVESSSKYFRANSPIEIGIELLELAHEKFQSHLKNGSTALLAKKEELKKLNIKKSLAKLNGIDPQVLAIYESGITELQEEISKLEKSDVNYKKLWTECRSLQLIQKNLKHLEKKYSTDGKLRSLLEKTTERIEMLHSEPDLYQVALDRKLINEAIAEKTKIPTDHLQNNKNEGNGSTLESRLNKEIIGQEEAIKVVCDAISAGEIGLKPKNRPTGVFMCVGPTGVGKTTLARLLGKEYMGDEKNLIRLDMTDYQEKHTVSNLSGSPKGYVNHEESAYWIKKIQENSRSVVLIDEIEKAHPDILLFFLKVFDEGYVTDNKGNRVDCSEALFIITSNAGSREILSFGQPKPTSLWNSWKGSEKEEKETLKTVVMRAVRNHPHFKPEFLNRIDEILVFNRLEDPVIIKKIIEKELHAFASLVHETQNITLKWTDEAITSLAVKGFDPVNGARPLRRIIEKEIRGVCIQAIKNNVLSKGCSALLTVSQDGEQFIVSKVEDN